MTRFKAVFRGLALGESALNLAFLAGTVPPEVQDRANQSFARDARPFLLFLGIACSLGLLKIAAEVGLFWFKRWARPLFATTAILGILAPFAVAVLPPEVAGVTNSPLEESLAVLLSMMDGAIVALAYGSPVRGFFARSTTVMAPVVDGAG